MSQLTVRARRTAVGMAVVLIAVVASKAAGYPAALTRRGVHLLPPTETPVVVKCVVAFEHQGAIKRCDGVLSKTFLRSPTRKELRSIPNILAQGHNAYRRMKCSTVPCDKRSADTFVNGVVQDFVWDDADNDVPIVFGAMRFMAGLDSKDERYGGGDDMEDTQEGRKLYFVGYKPTGFVSKPVKGSDNLVYGRTVAKWKLYQIVKNSGADAALTEVSSGTIVECTNSHPGNSLNAAFLGCKGEHAMRTFAASTGLPFDLLLALGDETRSRFTDFLALETFRKRYDPAKDFSRMFSTLAARDVDPDVASYWFSCANGCCTADF